MFSQSVDTQTGDRLFKPFSETLCFMHQCFFLLEETEQFICVRYFTHFFSFLPSVAVIYVSKCHRRWATVYQTSRLDEHYFFVILFTLCTSKYCDWTWEIQRATCGLLTVYWLKPFPLFPWYWSHRSDCLLKHFQTFAHASVIFAQPLVISY